jgi:type IV secretory pathway TraG/TraD family ATPase VirD4
MAEHTGREEFIDWATKFKSQPAAEREEKTSGLIAHLDPFASGEFSGLFNTDRPEIDMKNIVTKNEILYCQLPALSTREFSSATGKFLLQCFANAVAHRHDVPDHERKMFSAYLDDFSEYLYEGFVTILNKSRSADIGVTFAHQALGDIESLGENIANSIKSDASFKIFMKCVDPDSADYCARAIGTEEDEKYTQRSTRGILGQTETGEASVRDVESFLYRPQTFKNGLGVGEAIILVPHQYGAKATRVKFRRLPELPPVLLPKRNLPNPVGLPQKYRIVKDERPDGTPSAVGEAVTNQEVK